MAKWPFSTSDKIYKESIHFYKLILIIKGFLNFTYWGNSNHFFITSCKNNHSKIHSYENITLGEKDM